MNLPKHISLTISHNPHVNYYQLAETYLREAFDFAGRHDDECTEADYVEMLRTGEIWEVQWYPDTPVGFCIIYAPSLDRALERAGAKAKP